MTANSIAGDYVDESYLRKIVAEREGREYRDSEDRRMTFSDESLRDAKHFAPYLAKGIRLKVRRTYIDGTEFVRTGTVGITGGWIPAFLLMHRSNATGSWDVLDGKDEIIEIWDGRRYNPVRKASEFRDARTGEQL